MHKAKGETKERILTVGFLFSGNIEEMTYNFQSLVLNERHHDEQGAVFRLRLRKVFFVD